MKLKAKASSKGKKGAPAPDKTVSLAILLCCSNSGFHPGVEWLSHVPS